MDDFSIYVEEQKKKEKKIAENKKEMNWFDKRKQSFNQFMSSSNATKLATIMFL